MTINDTLETDRLILRQFREDDFAAVHEYSSDPEVVCYFKSGPNTEQETRDFIGRAINGSATDSRTLYGFAITVKADCRLIGDCGMTKENDHNAHIGYCLGSSVWGKGYATEAARTLVRFGFSRLKLHRIFASCDTENTASANVLQKVGMRREGCFREDCCIDNRWRDSYIYAILEHEWSVNT